MELHPIVTHFPIASVLFVLLFEVWRFIRRTQEFTYTNALLLVVGLVATSISFFSGLDAASEADITFKIPDEAVANHYNAARAGLIFYCFTAGFFFASSFGKVHRRLLRGLYVLFLFLTAVAIGVAGYFGGELVFTHGAGVSAILQKE